VAWTGKRMLTLVGLGAGVLVLYLLGAEKQNEGAGGGNTTQCRVTVTGDGVNIRSAPVPDRSAVTGDQASTGDEFDAEKTVQNGFRKLTDGRWLSTQYIRPLEGRDCG
jgi:hypothetical protein